MEKATIFNYARMCNKRDCSDCPLEENNNKEYLDCDDFIQRYPDKANEIILDWCRKHPVETRQDKFLKMFPNADFDENDILIIPPCQIDKELYDSNTCNKAENCNECRNNYWSSEVVNDNESEI